MREIGETFSCEIWTGNALPVCYHLSLVLGSVWQQWRATGAPLPEWAIQHGNEEGVYPIPCVPVCTPWLTLAFFAWFPGSFCLWVTGNMFCTFGPFYVPSIPGKLDLVEGIDRYWILFCFLTFDSAGIPYQLRLPLSDPKPEDEVGGLELHSCCSSSSCDMFLVCTLALLMRAGWPWEADSYQSFAV